MFNDASTRSAPHPHCAITTWVQNKVSVYVSKAEKSWHHLLYFEPAELLIYHTMETSIKRRSYKQASTVTKTRFFDAFDRRSPTEPLQNVIQSLHLPYSQRTTERWLRTRRGAGNNVYKAYHRGDKHHKKPSKITDAQLDILLDLKNPVRTQDLQTQIDFHNIRISKRAMQTNLIKRRHKAKRYKMARVTSISRKNMQERVEYGQEHQDKTVDGF